MTRGSFGFRDTFYVGIYGMWTRSEVCCPQEPGTGLASHRAKLLLLMFHRRCSWHKVERMATGGPLGANAIGKMSALDCLPNAPCRTSTGWTAGSPVYAAYVARTARVSAACIGVRAGRPLPAHYKSLCVLACHPWLAHPAMSSPPALPTHQAGPAVDGDAAHVAWVRSCAAALEPATVGLYVNEVMHDDPGQVQRSYEAAAYKRLLVLKRRVDPQGLLRGL